MAHRSLPRLLIAALALGTAVAATADEAAIRRNLPQRLPDLPAIDEVTRMPVEGLWEVRMGTEVLYTDAQGRFVIHGEILDTQRQVNLTEQRVDKLTAFDFAKLPLKDAVVWRQGTGARRVVVFADPNCGYCRRFEQELTGVRDVTVYTFLFPILGGDSPEKSRAIWCAKDRAAAWRGWMVDGKAPPPVKGTCDSGALERNVALGQRHGVQGTPSLVFEDSQRVPGILSAVELERKFTALKNRS